MHKQQSQKADEAYLMLQTLRSQTFSGSRQGKDDMCFTAQPDVNHV